MNRKTALLATLALAALPLWGSAPREGGVNAPREEDGAAATEQVRTSRAPFGTFYALHLEVGNGVEHQGKPYANGGSTTATRYQAHFWPDLVRVVRLADQNGAKLSLLAHPQWVEYISSDPSRLSLAQSWAENGHVWGLHHHGFDHPDWDGFSNRSEAKRDSRYRGNMTDLIAIVESLGVRMGVGTPTDRKAEMTDLVSLFRIDVAGKGGELSVAGRRPNRVSDLCPNLSFVQVGSAYQKHDQPSLEPAKVAYRQSGEGELFGLVTHLWDILYQADSRGALAATDFARWLDFLEVEGGRVETVPVLVSRYRTERGIRSGLETLRFGGGRGARNGACLSSGHTIPALPSPSSRRNSPSGTLQPRPPLVAEPHGLPTLPDPSSRGEGEAKLKIGFLFHLEGWHWDVESVFNRYRRDLLALADLFDAYNGTPTWEVRDALIVELDRRGDSLLANLKSRGHGIGVHADLGGNPDSDYTQREFAEDLLQRRMRIEGLAGEVWGVSGICSHLDWVEAAQRGGFRVVTGIVAYCLNGMPRSVRPIPYKDCERPQDCHQVYPDDLETRIHPWWARSGRDWLVPQSRGVLIAPSAGTLNCFAEATASGESHTGCSFNRQDILAWRAEMEEALSLVDSSTVNFHYVVWSFGSMPPLGVLEAWLEEVDTLVASGDVAWATISDLLDLATTLSSSIPTPATP